MNGRSVDFSSLDLPPCYLGAVHFWNAKKKNVIIDEPVAGVFFLSCSDVANDTTEVGRTGKSAR